MTVKLTRYTTDPVMAIEEAAANCYDSEPSSSGAIMRHCYKSGHLSPHEFATFTWHVEGVSRALLAQITRHRHAGFNVRSQRYCSESGFNYVVPLSILVNGEAHYTYTETMDAIQAAYDQLTKLSIPNEDARYLLPNACETQFEVCMNLRELIHVANERLCSRAQWEIRKLVKAMCDSVIDVAPQFKYMLVPKCEKHLGHPFCTEARSCGRHPKLEDVYYTAEREEN